MSDHVPVGQAVALARNVLAMLEAHCENVEQWLDADDQAVVDAWKRDLDRLANAPADAPAPAVGGDVERMLNDLLAVIHRDGGHRQEEVGQEQAWMEAMMMVPFMLDASAELASTQKQLAEARDVLVPFAKEADEYDYGDGSGPDLNDAPDASSLNEITDLTVGDLRRARAFLSNLEGSKNG